MTTFRNPHLPPVAPEPVQPDAESLPRLRFLTNDPAREYAQRPGQVAPLSNAVAALILCKTGTATVRNHQILVTIEHEDGTKERVAFTHRDSITIAELNGMDQEVVWAFNRMRPDLLHILTRDGAYVESLPRKGDADWFSNDAESREKLATARAHLARDRERLQYLHRPDTQAEVERAEGNAENLARVVKAIPQPTHRMSGTFPPAGARAEAASAPEGQHAQRMGEALQREETQREARATREKSAAVKAREAERFARTEGAKALDELLSPPAPRASFTADPAEAEAALEWLSEAKPNRRQECDDFDAERALQDLLG